MTDTPLVSVVVIFYNPGRFFADAIRSVLAQTYSNWELLLVDDGSADGSSELAREFAREQPERISYLQHPGGLNHGMSATRNLGLAHAQGKYVALLDADDLWLPNKLAEQVGLLERIPEAVALFGRSTIWHSWAPDASQPDWANLGKLRADRLIAPPEMMAHWLRDESFQPCTSEFIVHTEALRAVGGWDENFQGLYEDNVVYTKLFSQYPVYAGSHTWSRYRQHPDNCCHQAIARGEWQLGQANPAKERILLWIERYLCENHLMTPDLERGLRAAFLPFRNPTLYQVHRVARKLRLA